MLDLGSSFLASVARDPGAEAIVDGGVRLTYEAWFKRVSAACQGLRDLGVKRGERIVTALQNTADAATLHWACQLSGVVICPVNWRA